jgi:hypothetical protein
LPGRPQPLATQPRCSGPNLPRRDSSGPSRGDPTSLGSRPGGGAPFSGGASHPNPSFPADVYVVPSVCASPTLPNLGRAAAPASARAAAASAAAHPASFRAPPSPPRGGADGDAAGVEDSPFFVAAAAAAVVGDDVSGLGSPARLPQQGTGATPFAAQGPAAAAAAAGAANGVPGSPAAVEESPFATLLGAPTLGPAAAEDSPFASAPAPPPSAPPPPRPPPRPRPAAAEESPFAAAAARAGGAAEMPSVGPAPFAGQRLGPGPNGGGTELYDPYAGGPFAAMVGACDALRSGSDGPASPDGAGPAPGAGAARAVISTFSSITGAAPFAKAPTTAAAAAPPPQRRSWFGRVASGARGEDASGSFSGRSGPSQGTALATTSQDDSAASAQAAAAAAAGALRPPEPEPGCSALRSEESVGGGAGGTGGAAAAALQGAGPAAAAGPPPSLLDQLGVPLAEPEGSGRDPGGTWRERARRELQVFMSRGRGPGRRSSDAASPVSACPPPIPEAGMAAAGGVWPAPGGLPAAAGPGRRYPGPGAAAPGGPPGWEGGSRQLQSHPIAFGGGGGGWGGGGGPGSPSPSGWQGPPQWQQQQHLGVAAPYQQWQQPGPPCQQWPQQGPPQQQPWPSQQWPQQGPAPYPQWQPPGQQWPQQGLPPQQQWLQQQQWGPRPPPPQQLPPQQWQPPPLPDAPARFVEPGVRVVQRSGQYGHLAPPMQYSQHYGPPSGTPPGRSAMLQQQAPQLVAPGAGAGGAPGYAPSVGPPASAMQP